VGVNVGFQKEQSPLNLAESFGDMDGGELWGKNILAEDFSPDN
jgi:hypothetical protein